MSWHPSDAQLIASALCPKFTAMASVVGSALIIRDIIQIRNKKSVALSTRHRLLCGMSVCDILSSSACFLTSWPVPKDTPFAVWNVGTTQTCTAQGFFNHLAIGTVLYSACLALYYLLVIRHGWKNEYIAKRVEPWMHFVAIGFALSTGIASLALKIFNPIGFGYFCGIATFPPFCTQSYENKGPTDCTRGDNARIYHGILTLGPACCVVVWLAVSMWLVYWKIRTTERGSSRSQSQPGRMTQRFALQACMYVGAMIVTWSPFIGLYIHRLHSHNESNNKSHTSWVSRSSHGRREIFPLPMTTQKQLTVRYYPDNPIYCHDQ
jgi:hypothetical protein